MHKYRALARARREIRESTIIKSRIRANPRDNPHLARMIKLSPVRLVTRLRAHVCVCVCVSACTRRAYARDVRAVAPRNLVTVNKVSLWHCDFFAGNYGSS